MGKIKHKKSEFRSSSLDIINLPQMLYLIHYAIYIRLCNNAINHILKVMQYGDYPGFPYFHSGKLST